MYCPDCPYNDSATSSITGSSCFDSSSFCHINGNNLRNVCNNNANHYSLQTSTACVVHDTVHGKESAGVCLNTHTYNNYVLGSNDQSTAHAHNHCAMGKDNNIGFLAKDNVNIVYCGPAEASISSSGDVLKAFRIVNDSGIHNHKGAKITVASSLKIDCWYKYLTDYHDKLILQYLQFGFPLSVDFTIFQRRACSYNHTSANINNKFVMDNLNTELSHGAILGPFDVLPLPNCHMSPILTRDKDVNSKRIIVDLSYPKVLGLNTFVTKLCDGINFELKYPSVDSIAQRITTLGTSALLFKIDLK